MEQRQLEVTIISGYHLRNVKNFGGKMSPYAVAWIHPDRKERTPMDTDGGLDPKWNAKLNLVCEESLIENGNAIITIDIYDGSSISNKKIGTASIALSELPGGKAMYTRMASETKFLTLQIRRPSGRERGTLNISVKVGEVTKQPAAAISGRSSFSAGTDTTMREGRGCGLHWHRHVHRPEPRGLYTH